ncbi:glucose-6-phosphate isomerase [Candidatus Haliotispira prima]|uniref:Glucose-6-phosphate isomerase n=1 Tax=Candidatus Haliotispira prima TaxID=3034016 RepID=A0ABY8MIE0_9SPIO|nr:glucose-6-phosphate isomerase [Candidatus Haliotispira prima]
MDFRNLDRCVHYRMLKNASIPKLQDVLTPESVKNSNIPIAAGLTFNYAARGVNNDIIDLLGKLAEEQELLPKYRALVSGEVMNTGEQRKVLHHLLRGQLAGDVIEKGKNLRNFYLEQQERIADFANQVHQGNILGSTGKPFETIVQIGIGGSDLGPRALYIGLANLLRPKIRAEFISNVDPDDPNSVLQRLDPEKTLFILVSKSGTTQETLTNENYALRWLETAGKRRNVNIRPAQHMVVVTGTPGPLADNPAYLDSFYIDDYIGGRYSVTSAVGGVVLSLAFGPGVFAELLDGAAETDRGALENQEIRGNAPLMDAMIGIWERNICNHPATAVLPYSQALLRFPAHLQQLDMESNGKQVNRSGQSINYMTGPIIFGEPGTNGQHSFYQMLHQGTTPVPLQFIGFSLPQMAGNVEFQGSNSQKKLNANLCAQVAAFALGKEDSNPNKNFPGDRPSSLIYGKQLTPRILGALLAHFENKVMFQGFAWNINSFDQEGVQLGKLLTNNILKGQAGPLLDEYMKLLGS